MERCRGGLGPIVRIGRIDSSSLIVKPEQEDWECPCTLRGGSLLTFTPGLAMSLEQADVIFQHPSVVGLSRRRRLYAALVLGCAILIVLLICLSFSVREFRAVQVIRLSPKSASPGVLEEARQQALQVVRETTSEVELKKLVSVWTNRLNLSLAGGGLDPNQVDYEKLRARLTFALEIEPSREQLTLQLGYTGRGNLEERAFLRLFSERVAQGLRAWGSPQLDQLAEFRDLNSGSREREEQLEQCGKELNLELERLAGALTRLKAFPIEQLRAVPPVGRRVEVDPADSRRLLLEEKLEQLARQREDLLQEFPESHPEVLAIRREQERLQLQVMEDEQSAPKRISNQFVQASFPSQPEVESAPAVAESALSALLGEVETQSLVAAWERVHAEQAAWLQAVRRQQQAIATLATMEPRLEVAISGERVSAFGSLSSTNLMWAVLASLVLGGVIASRFDVWSFDRGFENSRAATESLAVPVFSWSSESPVEAAKAPPTASARILKLSEIVLFTTLLVVAGMMLIDAEYRAAVWENPLHLFARLLWMWKI